MGVFLKGLAGLIVLLAVVFGGAYLALARPDIPWATLEAKYATPPSQFLDLADGTHVHYRDQGDPKGPPILLVHGFGASLLDWEPWVAALRMKYRVVTVDLPGFGLTRAAPAAMAREHFPDFLDQFMAKIGLDHAAVAGNSMGGGAAWQFALAHPNRVSALILVDAAGWRSPAGKNQPLIFKLLAFHPAALYLRDLDASALIRQGLQRAFINQAPVTDAMVQRYIDLARAPGRRAALTAPQGPPGPETIATKDKLAKIAAPTLILWGDHDNLIDPGDAQKFADAIPGSTLIMYRDVGHVPMEEVPDQSAKDVDAWLTRVSAKPAPAPTH